MWIDNWGKISDDFHSQNVGSLASGGKGAKEKIEWGDDEESGINEIFKYYNIIILNIKSSINSHVNCQRWKLMDYRNVTYNIEESIIKEIKQMALDEDTSQKNIVNEILREGIQRKRGQSKLDEISWWLNQ